VVGMYVGKHVCLTLLLSRHVRTQDDYVHSNNRKYIYRFVDPHDVHLHSSFTRRMVIVSTYRSTLDCSAGLVHRRTRGATPLSILRFEQVCKRRHCTCAADSCVVFILVCACCTELESTLRAFACYLCVYKCICLCVCVCVCVCIREVSFVIFVFVRACVFACCNEMEASLCAHIRVWVYTCTRIEYVWMLCMYICEHNP
jgi:hypothetical protein